MNQKVIRVTTHHSYKSGNKIKKRKDEREKNSKRLFYRYSNGFFSFCPTEKETKPWTTLLKDLFLFCIFEKSGNITKQFSLNFAPRNKKEKKSKCFLQNKEQTKEK